MTALALAGPSLPLGQAESRRSINWMPVLIESDSGKGGLKSYMKQCFGLRDLGVSLGGPITGLAPAMGKLYAVADGRIQEVASDWSVTDRGGVGAGVTSLAVNQTQLNVIVAMNSYVLDLDTLELQQVTSNFDGSDLVSLVEGWGIYAKPGTRQWQITSNEDFATLDALQFASAEGDESPIVGHVAKSRRVLLLQENAGEMWYPSGDADFPFARDESVVIAAGCSAAHTVVNIGGVVYWLGRNKEGEGLVFGMPGIAPQRVSNRALEEKLEALDDLTQAWAFGYVQDGLVHYVLNVPGLDTTWVYEAAAGIWHERAELVDGAWQPWRAMVHAYVFGMHVIGDATGKLYELTPDAKTNGADPLVRDLITPHNATPNLVMQRFSSLQVNCSTGQGLPSGAAANLMLRYSNDGGSSWGDWELVPLGVVGDRLARARTTMLGSAIDRVWNFRVTDPVTCDLLSVLVNE